MSRIQQAFEHAEQHTGAAITYAAAAANVGLGTWLGNNWFLVLSAIAVLIRIGIDLPKLVRSWRRKPKED